MNNVLYSRHSLGTRHLVISGSYIIRLPKICYSINVVADRQLTQKHSAAVT